jgi:hypothetical protein
VVSRLFEVGIGLIRVIGGVNWKEQGELHFVACASIYISHKFLHKFFFQLRNRNTFSSLPLIRYLFIVKSAPDIHFCPQISWLEGAGSARNK